MNEARAEYVEGLRQLANLLEGDEKIPLPEATLSSYRLNTKAEAAELIRNLGSCRKEYNDSLFNVTKKLGGITYQVIFRRDAVCEAKVIGKKILPARPAQPAQPEQEVDDIQWVCASILEPDDESS